MAVDVDRDNNMNISVERRRSSRDNGGEREEFDLGTLMTHYETVREQLWPLYWLLVEIKRSRRWENYPLSLSAVTLTSLSLLFPRALFAGVVGVLLMVVVGGALFAGMVGVLLMVIVGGCQYLWPFGAGQRSRIITLLSLSLPRVDEDAEILEENLRAEKKRRNQLENYKKVIRKADELLVDLDHLLVGIKNIITWTNRKRSLIACLILLLVGGATIWCSVSTILTALYISIFCCNSYFITRTKQMLMKLKNLIQRNKIARQLSQHQLPRPIAALTRNDTVSSVTSATVEDLNSSNDSVNAERGGASTRDKGSCFKCKANFTIIKRKHPCNNCGHFFCSSCTVKVQKSLLGATSPAAFQQTVRVCLECKENLPKDTYMYDTI